MPVLGVKSAFPIGDVDLTSLLGVSWRDLGGLALGVCVSCLGFLDPSLDFGPPDEDIARRGSTLTALSLSTNEHQYS